MADTNIPAPLTAEEIEKIKIANSKEELYQTDAPEKERLKRLKKLGDKHGCENIVATLAQHFSQLVVSKDRDDKINANIILHDLMKYYVGYIRFRQAIEDKDDGVIPVERHGEFKYTVTKDESFEEQRNEARDSPDVQGVGEQEVPEIHRGEN